MSDHAEQERTAVRVAVAGGTGAVGHHAVASLRAAGHEPVVISRGRGVDARRAAGLDAALEGVDAVIDALSVETLDGGETVEFFRATTQNLLAAEARAGVQHHVALSIVAIERAPFGYYAGKVAQEQLVEAGDIPWTILRAAQFHEFAAQMYDRAKIGPLRVAPRMRTQPVAAREVGDALAAIAAGGAAGRVPDLAGPREESLVRMVRAYARAIGARGWLPAVPVPGPFGRAQRDGSLLPDASATLGRQTFDQWLAGVRPAR
ncbi:SDR family oxidoreductase [Microbacterium lushaniae]|uniref:SDR family oxidoreductase n=1 Tax=Microbacterium lushaniae TaxID=2614639 RepID=A0A5J6L689_9MICO|nr:SDR family oxidoreductase [Microbacterium lushaniae]